MTPILLAGGKGERLWPLSLDAVPKPFVSIPGMDYTLFQQAALRVSEQTMFAPPLVVCQSRHAALARAQLEDAGVMQYRIIEEDQPRNTAFAVLKALDAADVDGDTLCLVCPTDHWVGGPQCFRQTIHAAAMVLEAHALCLFGVEAGRLAAPLSAYGHILTADAPEGGIVPVERFVEKPSVEVVAGWRAAGVSSYINSGMVLGRAGAMLAALEAALGDVTHTLREPEDTYPSFDVAVLEQTGSLRVAPLSSGWRDLGTWPELLGHIRRDGLGNAVSGSVVLDGVENCIVFQRLPEELEIAGVKDLVIIADDNALMVASVSPGDDTQGGMVWQRYPFTGRLNPKLQALWSLGDECAR